ncbi:MAG: hypothetical protein V2B15_10170 [Bacteroidota bacterium]
MSLLLLPLLLFSCQQEISPAQAEKFIKFYGNSLMDEARDVEVLDDGSYAICGVDTDAEKGERAVLFVTDKFGNVKPGFPRYYAEGNLNSGANALVVKGGGTGGFLLVGYVDKPVLDTIPPIEVRTQKDLFLVRTSSTGQEFWKKSFGSMEDESVLHATGMIASGGFILAGYQVHDGKTDIMVMGVTDQGDSITPGLNYYNPLSNKAAANYILNAGDKYLCVCTYDKVGTDGTDILILNFDDELSPNDGILGGDFEETGQCIIEDGANRYLVLGNRINISGNTEIVVHMIETNGLLITKTLFLETISEQNTDLIAKRFVKTEDSRFAIVGTRQSGGNSDIFLQFLLPDYQAAERIIFGAAGNQSGADIDLPADGGLLMLGTNGYDANSMISLIRTGDAGDL